MGTDYCLDEPDELESFWESYSGPVELEPDRFVVLLNNNFRVEFRREPC